MNIPELIKEAHDNAVGKGFFDCPECVLQGKWNLNCITCNGTYIDPNKNIGELLMLIVSELGEALEAHRCGRFADWGTYEDLIISETTDFTKKCNNKTFECNIKGTFEDEIADVFIRLFDFMGYMNIPLNESFYKYGYDSNPVNQIKENTGDELMIWVSELVSVNTTHKVYEDQLETCTANFGYLIKRIETACEKWNIPIEKHIKAKMAYNRTRPHKHGKEY